MKKIYAIGLFLVVSLLIFGIVAEAYVSRVPRAVRVVDRIVSVGHGNRGEGSSCPFPEASSFLTSKQFLLWNQNPVAGEPFEFVYGRVGLDISGQPLFSGTQCIRNGPRNFVPIADVIGGDFSDQGFSGIWTPAGGESGGLSFTATVSGTGPNGHPTWQTELTQLLGGFGQSFWWE